MNSGSNNLKSNRIAEYIVVIGAGDVLVPLSIDEQKNYAMLNPLKMDYTTSILDRYPLEDKPDISLPSGLTLFCLPHGLQIYEGPRSPKFFSFIQTSDRGLHLLGCCLVFFECLTDSQLQSLKDLLKTHNLPPEYATPSKGKKFFIPKCLCLISQWPFVESFKKYLRFLYSLSLNPSHIPIEKYISNFLEDVPAPPPGRVEVLYCVGNENLSFQRPPTNEPNVWSGLPMKPLFECFSNGDVLQLMGCVICERQIVFVSSQYSLLSSCAEVLLSLIYPLTWTHVYIPILPRRLIGVLSAPVPFIVGIHYSYFTDETCWDTSESRRNGSICAAPSETSYEELHAAVSSETVKVFIDDGRIDFGILGPPPALPENRGKKLLNELNEKVPCRRERPDDWRTSTLPFFDYAFDMSVRPDAATGNALQGKLLVDEKKIHEVFLKFFVGVMMNYRRFLVYPSKSDPLHLVKFRTQAFLTEQPQDSVPFLTQMLQSQAFYQFVDARISTSGFCDSDILFFDESIDAKLNRYSLQLHVRDTPFLNDKSNKHVKTYVVESVDHQEQLDESSEHGVKEPADAVTVSDGSCKKSVYASSSFPKLNPTLFRRPNKIVKPQFVSSSTSKPSLAVAGSSPLERIPNNETPSPFGMSRLKRMPILRAFNSLFETPKPPRSPSSSQARVFNTFLMLFAKIVSSGMAERVVRRAPPTIAEVIDKLAVAGTTRRISLVTANVGNIVSEDAIENSSSSEGGSDKVDVMVRASAYSLSNRDSILNPTIPSNVTNMFSPQKERASQNSASQTPSMTRLISSDSDVSDSNRSRSAKAAKQYADDLREEFITTARAALETAFEIFHLMDEREYDIDTLVYRYLADACAVCGDGEKSIQILEVMCSKGILPDMAIASAVSHSLSFFNTEESVDYVASQSQPVLSGKDVYEAAASKNIQKVLRAKYPLPLKEQRRQQKSRRNCSIPSTLVQHHLGSDLHAKPHASEMVPVGPNAAETWTSSIRWANLTKGTTPVCASPAVFTTVLFAERALDFKFPGLDVDLLHEFGTRCPRTSCSQTLTLDDLSANWESDPNKYTIRCPHCQMEFVPRFSVYSTASGWIGNEGPNTPLWCEMLSPYVLQKEIMTVLSNDGLEYLMHPDFRDVAISTQNPILYWNMLIAFRSHGLPYAFLVCDKISMAFMVPLDDV